MSELEAYGTVRYSSITYKMASLFLEKAWPAQKRASSSDCKT